MPGQGPRLRRRRSTRVATARCMSVAVSSAALCIAKTTTHLICPPGTDDVPLPAPTARVEPDRKATAQLLEQAGVLSPKVLATSAGAKVRAE